MVASGQHVSASECLLVSVGRGIDVDHVRAERGRFYGVSQPLMESVVLWRDTAGRPVAAQWNDDWVMGETPTAELLEEMLSATVGPDAVVPALAMALLEDERLVHEFLPAGADYVGTTGTSGVTLPLFELERWREAVFVLRDVASVNVELAPNAPTEPPELSRFDKSRYAVRLFRSS